MTESRASQHGSWWRFTGGPNAVIKAANEQQCDDSCNVAMKRLASSRCYAAGSFPGIALRHGIRSFQWQLLVSRQARHLFCGFGLFVSICLAGLQYGLEVLEAACFGSTPQYARRHLPISPSLVPRDRTFGGGIVERWAGGGRKRAGGGRYKTENSCFSSETLASVFSDVQAMVDLEARSIDTTKEGAAPNPL